jgi:TRAP-type mannitol/chloroaromatic compound transport system permease small subunit
MVKPLTALTRFIDQTTELIGKVVSILAILMVVVTCYIVIARYVFNTGSIAVQESVIYFNAILFMLSAGFTLKHNGHVRVDVFYGKASPRYKAWVDLFGSLFLLMPVAIFIMVASWDYVSSAFAIKEQSGEAGGLPWVYLLKGMIPVMSIVLIFQGIAEIIRNAFILFAPDSELARSHTDEEAGAL